MGNFQSAEDQERILTSFDEVSGTFDFILTYAIHHLFPAYFMQRMSQKSVREYMGNIEMDNQDNIEDKQAITFHSGSQAEGLCLITDHPGPQGNIKHGMSDNDIMLITRFPVAETLQNAIERNFSFYLDTSDTYPGYARVKWVNPENNQEIYLWNPLSPKHNPGFVDIVSRKPGVVECSIHGPAIRSVRNSTNVCNLDMGKMPYAVKEVSIPTITDEVFALPLAAKPTFIREWKHNSLGPNFLESLLNKTDEKKCPYPIYLVPVAHPSSKDPDVEWRISFSVLELLLCQELTTVQRQVFMTFKYLVKEATKDLKEIKSYYMKTTLFWTLETAPSVIWKGENMAKCLYMLLDKFIDFLADKNLPHYFVLGNNLIGHLSGDQIKPALNALRKIRKDPIAHIIKFQKKSRLAGHNRDLKHGFEMNLFRFLDLIKICLKAYGNECKFERALTFFKLMNLLCLTELYVCSDLLLENRVSETFHAMNFYFQLSQITGIKTLVFGYFSKSFPREVEDFYRFSTFVCKYSYRVDLPESCFYLLKHFYKHFEKTGILTGPLCHRFKLLEATVYYMTVQSLDSNEKVRCRLDQCAVVFDTLVNEKQDVVTLCEYLCFFSELWHDRFQTVGCKTFCTDARKFIQVLRSLISITKTNAGTEHREFYCVKKYVCLADVWEPNIIHFIKNRQFPIEIPHEIIGLFEGLLTVRNILVPGAQTLLSQMGKHSLNPIKDLLQLLQDTQKMTEEMLCHIVKKCNTDPFAYLHYDISLVNFLFSLTMMYAGDWKSAYDSLANMDQEDYEIAQMYQSICKLVKLYLMSTELTHNVRSSPVKSKSKTKRKKKEKFVTKQSFSGLLCNQKVDMSSYGCANFTLNMKSRITWNDDYVETFEDKITAKFDENTLTVPYDDILDDYFEANYCLGNQFRRLLKKTLSKKNG